jgi:hypothetical protein
MGVQEAATIGDYLVASGYSDRLGGCRRDWRCEFDFHDDLRSWKSLNAAPASWMG